MKQHVFTVYDIKADAYLPPFIEMTVDLAKRRMQMCVADGTHLFAQFPDDFTLYELGIWDDNKGEVTMHKAMVSHGLASRYMGSGPPVTDLMPMAIKGGE